MVGTYSTNDGVAIHSTYCSVLWLGFTFTNKLIQDPPQPQYIQTTNFLALILISSKASSTGTPPELITVYGISGYQAT